MANRNPPPMSTTHRTDSQPDADAESFAYDRNAVAEDPLVELARIVSEAGRIEPDFSATSRAPTVHSTLNEDLTGGLEAELMAELRPSYPDNADHLAPAPQVRQPETYPVNEELGVQPEPSYLTGAAAAPQADTGAFARPAGFTLGRDTSFPDAAQPAYPSDYSFGADDPGVDHSGEDATGHVPEPALGHVEQIPPEIYAPAPNAYDAYDAYDDDDQPQSNVDDMSWPAAEAAISNAPESFFNENALQRPEGDGLDGGFDDIFEPEPEYAPGISQEHVLPPHSEAERDMAPEVRSNGRGLVVVGAVIAVVALGGAGFLLSGLFGDKGPVGPAEVIAADTGPFKVFPAEQRNEANPSKAIYDRVGEVAAPSNEQLVSREEAPVAAVPTTNGSQPRQVTGDRADETPQSREAAPSNGLPRRVRTVVVRPDGTIINAPSEPVTEPIATPEPVRSIAAAPNAAVAPVSPALPTTPSVNDQIAAAPNASAFVAPVAPTGVARETDAGVAAPSVLFPQPKPAVPAGQRVAAAPATTGSQDNTRSGPLDLSGGGQAVSTTVQPPAAVPATPSVRAAPIQSASVPSGAYIVQISSQRSREQAESSYAGMQRRYASVLGDVSAVIQAADLGDRGIFYRVRVVAESQSAANRLCENLKAAGGDCFVRRAQ